jgi:hypothetical protein
VKYKHEIKMPTITLYTPTKISKRNLLRQAVHIIIAELENTGLYTESQGEFKVKTTKAKK